jgi:glyceraldehyde 3-phosphate dehydrogenase
MEVKDGNLVINGKAYEILSEKDPANLPWKEKGVEIIFECTGIFDKSEDFKKHIQAGAQHVILSAPAKSEDVPTLVHRVNSVD